MTIINFKDYPEFKPNLTPREIFTRGSFGGTYYRPIHSGVTGRNYMNQHREFEWLKDIPENRLTSEEYDINFNKYKVHSGTSLLYWESRGWIVAQDPYGWVQWYCRFYDGRRTEDDDRQIKRWLAFSGPKGRFRNMLINKIKHAAEQELGHALGPRDKWSEKVEAVVEKKVNDYSISPVIRQGLQHWAYVVDIDDISA
jgi:hypothetical protein